MKDWNHNIDAAPKGGYVERTETRKGEPVKIREWVSPRIHAVSSDHRVITSRWLPDLKKEGEGRWEMFSKDHPPLAWIAFPEYSPVEGSAS